MDNVFCLIRETTELADGRKSCNFLFIETVFRNFAIASSNKIGLMFRKVGGALGEQSDERASQVDSDWAMGASCCGPRIVFQACGRQSAESAILNG